MVATGNAPVAGSSQLPCAHTPISSNMPTTRLMEAIYPLVAGPELVDYQNPIAVRRWQQSRGRFQQEYFIPVGDLLCTLLLSGACGMLGQFVYVGRVRNDRVATKVVE